VIGASGSLDVVVAIPVKLGYTVVGEGWDEPTTEGSVAHPDGHRAALFFTRTYARLFRSGLAQVIPADAAATSKLRAAFDHLDRAIDTFCLANKLAA
jgi:hypothetical protein